MELALTDFQNFQNTIQRCRRWQNVIGYRESRTGFDQGNVRGHEGVVLSKIGVAADVRLATHPVRIYEYYLTLSTPEAC